MEFYYLHGNEKRGPINTAQLRALVLQGVIVPETTVLTGGRTLPARKIKGLEFPAAVPPVAPSVGAEPTAETVYPVVPPLAEPAVIGPEPPAAPETKSEVTLEKTVPGTDPPRSLLHKRSEVLEKEGLGFFILAGIIVFIAMMTAAGTDSVPLAFGVGGSAFPLYVLGRFFRWLGAYGKFVASRDKHV